MTPAKCSQYSPLSCTLDKHYAETAKKRMLCQNLLTFLMSSVSQTHTRTPVSWFGPISDENPHIIPLGALSPAIVLEIPKQLRD